MSTALVPASSRYEDPEMLQTLRDTVCKGATPSQFRMFIEICTSTGLNPFLKEIWFVPGVGVMAGRDGYLRVANEHPQFDGMETLVERDEKGIPIKATCKVWRKDRSHPITCEAYYNEYKKASSVWATYKSAMIGKVAEVLALKRSFSINGVVTEEEIGEQEPRGSREAQREVAEQRIAEMKAQAPQLPPPAAEVHQAEFVEPPTELEQQLQASIEQVQQQPDKFKALAGFQELKKAIVDATGDDKLYYRVLGANGYEKSNQIPKAKMREVWKAIAESLKDWKAEQP